MFACNLSIFGMQNMRRPIRRVFGDAETFFTKCNTLDVTNSIHNYMYICIW